MNNILLRRLVVLHNKTKSISIAAEELGDQSTDFQTVKEHRDAYEHIMRIYAAELDIVQPPDGLTKDQYSDKSLDKALGHEFRAFYDASDLYSIRVKAEIYNILNPFTVDCIRTAIPNYFSEIKPKFYEIIKLIGKMRENKDIINDITSTEIDKYIGFIEELENIFQTIKRALPSMKEFRGKEIWDKVIWVIAGGVLIGLIILLIEKLT